MEDYYSAVVLKNSSIPQSQRRQLVGRKGNPDGAGVGLKSPRKKDGGPSKKFSGKKSGSKSPRKGRKKKAKKTAGKGKRGGGGGDGGGKSTAVSKKVYSSAWAFMAEHFPSEDGQVSQRRLE